MSYYQTQADPRRNIIGISVVVSLHVVVAYALATGLAQKVVEVIRSPIETKVIEEIKDTPPPPEIAPPPPVLEVPPPPFIPPPEVTIATPAPVEQTIAVATPEVPPPREFTPTPAPVVVAPPLPPVAKPAAVSIGVACPTRALPKLGARQEGVNGSVRARLTIKGGKVVGVDILNSSPKGLFDAVVRTAVLQYGCQSEGDQVVVAEQTFNFTAE